MKIGIDISRANIHHRTGVESYVYHIFSAIQECKKDGDSIIAYVREKPVQDILCDKSTILKVLSWPPKFLWTQLRLSVELLFHSVDALFIPGHVLPLIHPKKAVFFVHDIAAARFPEVYSSFERWYSLWSVKFAIFKKAIIVVPSEHTKKEIMHFFPNCQSSNIHVIPHGIEKYTGQYRKIAQLENESFFLVVGRMESKKNCERIIAAFSLIDTSSKLVFIGGKGYGYEDIANAISSSTKSEQILELGFVQEEEKQWLYKHAQALVFPSNYEGFGFPAFEALLMGCPVITSENSPMEEYLGEYVTIVNPLSIDSIAFALKKHSNVRLILDAKIPENICNNFTWKKSAQKILQLI